MNSNIISELERNGTVIQDLISGLSNETILWRSEVDKWNLLDLITHLVDEEKEDFRARIQSVLENPSKPLVQIDPEGWVKFRNYQNNDFAAKLTEFVAERKASVQWLRDLQNPKWNNAYQHDKLGPMTAQLFLENWLAHDLLHIRQILRIKFGYLKSIAKNPLSYAGNW